MRGGAGTSTYLGQICQDLIHVHGGGSRADDACSTGLTDGHVLTAVVVECARRDLLLILTSELVRVIRCAHADSARGRASRRRPCPSVVPRGDKGNRHTRTNGRASRPRARWSSDYRFAHSSSPFFTSPIHFRVTSPLARARGRFFHFSIRSICNDGFNAAGPPPRSRRNDNGYNAEKTINTTCKRGSYRARGALGGGE